METVLLVAHMPGVAELLLLLTPEFAEMTVALNPANLVGITFPEQNRWEEVVIVAGMLRWLLLPLFYMGESGG